MPVINYPGDICIALDHFANTFPLIFKYGWRILFSGVLVFLYVSTYLSIKFENGVLSTTRFKYLLSPFVFILTICLGVFILRIPNLLLPEQNVDESQWIASGATYWHGSVLWKSISGTTSGPLVFVPIDIMVLFGGLNYASVRLFGLLFCIIPSIYLTWKAIDLLYGKIAARIGCISLFIFFTSIHLSDFIAYNSEHVPMVLIALAIYLLLNFSQRTEWRRTKLFFIGFALGSLPYAKLQALPIGLIIGILGFYEIMQYRNTPVIKKAYLLLLLTSAALLPTFLVGLYLSYYGCWSDFWQGYILENLFYAKHGLGKTTHRLNSYLGLLKWIILGKDMRMFLYMPISLIIGLIFIKMERGMLKAIVTSKKLFYSLSIFLAALVSVISPGNAFYHYVLLLIIPFILFTSFFIGELLPRPSKNLKAMPILFGSVYGIFILGYIIGHISDYPNDALWQEAPGQGRLTKVSQIIKRYTKANERMSIWGWGNVYYVETELIQGNKYPHTFYLMTCAADSNPYIVPYLTEMMANKPVVFLDNVSPCAFGFSDPMYKHENYPMINDYISHHYRLVGDSGGDRVYVRNDREMAIDSAKGH